MSDWVERVELKAKRSQAKMKALNALRTVTFLLGCFSTVLAPLSRSTVGFCLFLTYGIAYLTASIYFQHQIEKTTNNTNKVWAEEHLKMQLSLWQRLVLKINGHVFLRYEKRQGWKDYLPIYLVKCPHCKQYFTDYPHYYCTYFIHTNCEKGGH